MKGFIEIFTSVYIKFRKNILQIPEIMKNIDEICNIIQEIAFTESQEIPINLKKASLNLLKEICSDNQKHIKIVLSKFYSLIKYFF